MMLGTTISHCELQIRSLASVLQACEEATLKPLDLSTLLNKNIAFQVYFLL